MLNSHDAGEPALAESVEIPGVGVANKPPHYEVIQNCLWCPENGRQSVGADNPVFPYPRCPLQQARGNTGALVDGTVKHRKRNGRGHVLAAEGLPILAGVYLGGVGLGEVGHVNVWVRGLGNAEAS